MSSDNSNRVLYALKSRGPLSARTLGRLLGITEVGVRQHLAKLHGEGLVAFDDQAGEIGRRYSARLHELRPQAVDVLRAALERVPQGGLPRRS